MRAIVFFALSVLIAQAFFSLCCYGSVYAAIPKPKRLTGFIKKVKNSGKNVKVKLPKYSLTVTDIGRNLKKYSGKKYLNKMNKYRKSILKNEKKANPQAKESYSIFESNKIQAAVGKDEIRLLGSGKFKNYIPHNAATGKYIKYLKENKPVPMQGGHRIFMVISSSIPYKTLRNYIITIVTNNLPVQMILRGLVKSEGGKLILPTIKYIERLIHFKGKSGYYDIHVDIDPVIVAKYNIKAVPALIYVKNFNPQTYTALGEKAYVVYGDADLKYELEVIERKTESRYIKEILYRFKKKQFFEN